MEQFISVEDIIKKSMSIIESSGYSKSHLRCCKWTYHKLQSYCNDSGVTHYTENIGAQFLVKMSSLFPNTKSSSFYRHKSAIKRLNCILQDKVWEPTFEKVPNAYASSCFNDIVNSYEAYLLSTGKSITDTRARMHKVSEFLSNVESIGCTKFSDMAAETIYVTFQNSSNKASFSRCVRPFLLYAYRYGLIHEDLGLIMPRVTKRKSLPSIYTPVEIEQLLSVPNRDTAIGKRDYAIMLIGARLGLRACDIAAMTFDFLHHNKETIEIIQSKTRQPLSLPLLEEVNDALRDYIDNGRGNNIDTHIFLRERGYGSTASSTIKNIVRNSFAKSDIELGTRRTGPHSLRSSLATALFDEGNEYAVAQAALGHKDLNVSMSYIRMDIENLRSNALSVPIPSGNFAQLLDGGR